MSVKHGVRGPWWERRRMPLFDVHAVESRRRARLARRTERYLSNSGRWPLPRHIAEGLRYMRELNGGVRT